MSEDTLRTHPGIALATARAERNLTQRDVADVLNLSVAVVEAIETGDQQHLPGHVFTTGYIRAYAKLVDLDPEPMLANMVNHDPVETQPNRDTSINLMPIQLPPSVLIGVGVVFVLLLVWVVWPSSESNEGAGQVSSDTVNEVVDQMASTVEQAQPAPDFAALESAQPEVNRSAAPPDPVDDEALIDRGGDEIDVVTELTAAADQPVSDLPVSTPPVSTLREGYLPLTGAGFQLLDLDFTEECWVEIKDADGTTLFADLGRPGRTFRFQGEGPFHVLLGYAPGVLLSFNEEPVVLSPHTRNNVASVVLGQ